MKLGQIFWPEKNWSMPKKLSFYLCRNLSCKKMITVPSVLYWPLSVSPSSLFHEWDDNHVMQFIKIISQLGFLHIQMVLHIQHPQASDANSGWVAESAAETSWYQSKLAYSSLYTLKISRLKHLRHILMIRLRCPLPCTNIWIQS